MDGSLLDLHRKRVFFDTLDALDKSDEDDDVGLRESIAAATKSTLSVEVPKTTTAVATTIVNHATDSTTITKSALRRSNLPPTATSTLTRAVTLPDRIDSLATNSEGHTLRSTHDFRKPPILKHSTTVPENPSVPLAKTTGAIGKRRKSGQFQLVPEGQRIFTGLQLYFVPNNDVARARRMRIEKAIEYGANWAQEWHNHITHIVADKDLTYQDVLKGIGLAQIPAALTVVNERYLSDCISWKQIIDANSPVYQVKGSLVALAPSEASLSIASEKSLQIKPVKPNQGLVVQPEGTNTTRRTSDTSVEGTNSTKNIQQLVRAAGVQHLRNGSHNEAQDEFAAENVSNVPATSKEGTPSSDSGEDLLQAAINQAKATEHLLVDSEDEDDASISSSAPAASPGSDNERPANSGPKKTKSSNVERNFACMQGSKPDISSNPNARTIGMLEEMARYYDSSRDHWRTTAYRKAIAVLKKQSTRITTKEEAERLPFVGSRLATKIEEIVLTNRLRRLENTRGDPTDESLRLFAQIYGVGKVVASKWVQQGHRTIADILTNVKLTDAQQIGVDHLDDFLARIPRNEVRQHGEIVRRALRAIDPICQVTVGGSYRRGSNDSGDIDMVITKPGADAAYLAKIILHALVPALFEAKYLTAGLQVSSKDDGSKWHGACQLPPMDTDSQNGKTGTNTNPWRRIDLLLVPWDEIGAAMIYFTGNDIFNRSMRLLARTKGMRLNQRGLYKDVIRSGQVKLTEGTKIAGADEKEIFKILGVPWREPDMRNC